MLSKGYDVGAGLPPNLLKRLQGFTDFLKEPARRSNLLYIARIIQLNAGLKGVVVECGNGRSTAFLALACQEFGRQLFSFDSFKGLPDDGGVQHVYPWMKRYGFYRPGIQCNPKHQVEAWLRHVGCSDVCTLVEGDVADTLRFFHETIAFASLDLDLVKSTKDAIKYVWPLMVDGGMMFTDEAIDMECCRIFFDDKWWNETLGCQSPGYIGSGCGLPFSRSGSSTGYAIKMSSVEAVGFVHYHGLEKCRRDKS
ncbi:MAG TPA: class I SAM-dependent methyltransferase [bacterium]|nr:class I SAM-dependent methyltransferase [bacterium]